MSCAVLSQNTTAAVARQIQCPDATGAEVRLPQRARLCRTKPEIRRMIEAIQKSQAAARKGEAGSPEPVCPGDPREMARQLQSVLDGRPISELLPPDAKPEDTAQQHVYGWLTGQAWSELDRYLPHRGLRGVVITREGGRTRMHKLMGDGALLDADPSKPGAEIAAWLEQNDYVQSGALLKQDGDGANQGDWAVCYLRPWDSPELLSGALGRPVAPATLAYYPVEDKLATNRLRGNIKRDRERARSAGRDLGVVELPTRAARQRLYGVDDVAQYAGRYTDSELKES